MRVFVGGATGVIGLPLVRRLVERGHEVIGTSRSRERAAASSALGARMVVLDAFDREAVRSAILAARPDVVVHQLTALPADATRRALASVLATTARLRRETVPVFAAAAREAGARRFVVQSISFATRPEGPAVLDERAPLWRDAPAEFRETVEAVRVLEEATLGTAGLEGIVLRYGFFYGPGTWYARDGAIARMVRQRRYPLVGDGGGIASFVHVDDAAEATVLALDRGTPGIYNVTDDEPIAQRDWLLEIVRLLEAAPPHRLPAWLARLLAGPTFVHYATTLRGAANAKAKRELGWTPRPRPEGFREVFGPQVP